MSETTLVSLIMIGFPFVFAFFWCMVMAILSFIGGWNKLASAYAVSNPENINWLSWQTARIGPVDYNSSLWIAVDPKGLYLKTGPWILYRFLHPPLLIPWKNIKDVKPKSLLFFKYTGMNINGVNVLLPGSVLEEVKQHVAPYSF